MTEVQQILSIVKALQSSVNSLEVKVGNLIYRQDILESSLHRLISKLDHNLGGSNSNSRSPAPKADPIPISPAPARSNSMTPTPPNRPVTPSMPTGRPQIMASRSVGASRPPAHSRKPVEAGNYTGTLSAEDMMGECASPSVSRFGAKGEEDDESGGAGSAYANARGSADEPSNYSAAMSSHDIDGESGGNYTNQLTTDNFIDDDSVGTPVHMTIEGAVRPHAFPKVQATSPIHLPHPVSGAIPGGKRHEGKDSLGELPPKPRSASIGVPTGLPLIPSARPPSSESEEAAPNPKGLSRTSSEDHPIYNVVRESSRGPKAHVLNRTSSNESPRYEESLDTRGPEGDEVQGPGPAGDEEWDKYPEFDVERFSHFRRFTRDEASAKLNPHPDGVYVIRPCGDTSLKNNPDVFVLSFYARSPNNARLLTNIKVFRFRRGKNRGFGLWGQHPEMFPTMERMVKQHLPDLRPYDEFVK